jgi:hypothetical protein
MNKRFKMILWVCLIVISGCTQSSDVVNNQDDDTNNNKHDSDKNNNTVKAYFGDTTNNTAVVVNVDTMTLENTIATNHSKTYALEIIKLKGQGHNNKPTKMYIDNRGSNALDVFDIATQTITKTIDLDFYPRSIAVEKNSGLVAVSGTNKAMISIINSLTNQVIATVGQDKITYPTTSGHDYLSSGTLASGHPHWLDEKHFVLINRQNMTISTYKIEQNTNNIWETTKINVLTTSSPVHNLIPPEIHGQHGDVYGSSIFYATAEGSTNIYPQILKLEFTPSNGLSLLETLTIKKDDLLANEMGVHHLNFLEDQKTIYVGSHEGTLFVVDYTTSPMSISKTIQAGIGAGHTDEFKHNNIAIVINHKDKFITLINSATHTKIADIQVSNLETIGTQQTQSHPQYHFSEDGRYIYLFLTQEGELVKVDLTNKKVIQRVKVGGTLTMGTFTH